jgi:hypothetical protein
MLSGSTLLAASVLGAKHQNQRAQGSEGRLAFLRAADTARPRHAEPVDTSTSHSGFRSVARNEWGQNEVKGK